VTSSDEIRERGLYPNGFLPLPHPNHSEGGMLFPRFHIEEIQRQSSATSRASISISTFQAIFSLEGEAPSSIP
jgi:hypothetical protein